MAGMTESTISPHSLWHREVPTKNLLRAALAATLLAGVGLQAFGQACTNLCLKQVSCPTGQTTSISGTVYTPNGVDPLPNVVVYVPNAAVPAFPAGVACVTSAQPVSGTPLVGTTTSATTPGTYTLTNMPVGDNIPVVIQAGRWRRQYTVSTTACKNTPLNMSFPSTHTQGDIPLIAVATGSVDAAECVLRKVGIADSEFTVPTASGGTGRIQLYKGSESPGTTKDVNNVALPSETVLVGTTVGTSALNNYDIIMFPCQGSASGQTTSSSQTNLINYTTAGGRVFATHYSYAWLYNVSPFSGTAKWNVNQATFNNGPATIDTTFAGGQQLAQWLYNIGATPTYGLIPTLTEPKNDQLGVIAPTQSWFTLNSGSTSNPHPVMQFTFDTPVGATSSAQCGRVLFNEYHVEAPNTSSTYSGAFPTECYASGSTSSGAMTANEQLLEYSLFDLSTFITAQTPPTITATISNSPTDFFQGDAADSVIVNVTNVSTTSPANPSLTATVTLPPGVTATAMQDAGTGGWLCTVSTLTCTRITGLDANTSDSFSITVAVSPTAPLGVVTASVDVAGGGLTTDVTASESFHIYGVPIITWPAPASFTYGPALSATQLDATANVPGVFVYTPVSGTVLDAGAYTLSSLFTATDAVNYPRSVTTTVPLTVNQIPQIITFAPIATPVTYGVAPVTISATGGASGNPVTFTVTGPATLSGNTLTYTAAGTVTITASQAGTIDYSAAAPVTQTIVVNQIAQTITFAPIATPVTYGVAPVTISATGGASGNPVTFTVTGPATLSGNTLTYTAAGTVTITADQTGNNNYSAAAPVTQTIVVNQIAQTITFAPIASPVTYGVAPITISATGGASGNPVTFSVTGPATLSGNTLTIIGGGTVTVTAAQAGNTDYSAAPNVSQTLVVNPAAQAITFAPLVSPVYYGISPMTLSATGGASGNPVTFKVLSGSAIVSGTTLTITGAGNVVVAADEAGNANYSAAPEVTQTVVVYKLTTSATLSAAPTTLFIKNPITLTVNMSTIVPVACGNTCVVMPTGTVTFTADGSTPLGTATLTNGTAALTTAFATIGQHTITAVYNGDTNYDGYTTNTVTATLMDFTLTPVGTISQDIVHGSSASFSFVVTPVGGATMPQDIQLSVADYFYASVVTFTPAAVPTGSGVTSFVLTLQVPSYPTQARNANRAPERALALLVLGALLLPFGYKSRKRLGRLLTVLVLLAGVTAMSGLTGCGAGWNHEDSTPTVTAQSGALAHSTGISLTVH